MNGARETGGIDPTRCCVARIRGLTCSGFGCLPTARAVGYWYVVGFADWLSVSTNRLSCSAKRGDRRSEVKLQRIAQILKRFVFSPPLTRNVNLYALSHEPFILLPDAGAEFLFHWKLLYL